MYFEKNNPKKETIVRNSSGRKPKFFRLLPIVIKFIFLCIFKWQIKKCIFKYGFIDFMGVNSGFRPD